MSASLIILRVLAIVRLMKNMENFLSLPPIILISIQTSVVSKFPSPSDIGARPTPFMVGSLRMSKTVMTTAGHTMSPAIN